MNHWEMLACVFSSPRARSLRGARCLEENPKY